MSKRIIAWQEYVTVDGNSFDQIAYDFYDEEQMAVEIMNFNSEYSHVVLFPAGIRLRLPIFEQEETKRHIPPWERS